MKPLSLTIVAIAIVGCFRPTEDAGGANPKVEGVAAAAPASPPVADVAPADADLNDAVPIERPSRENVVVVAATLFPPKAGPGDSLTLAVRFRTMIGWHFFAVGDGSPGGPVLPTTLDLNLPASVSTDGEWELPETDIYDGPTGRSRGYSGDVTFRRRLRIDTSQAPGVLTLPLTVSYQACDDSICTRPAPADLQPTIEITN